MSETARATAEASLARADALLAGDATDLAGLILKGHALTALGDRLAASTFYSTALRRAAGQTGLSADILAGLGQARQALKTQNQDWEAHLNASLARAGFDPAKSSDRFGLSLDLMAGRKQMYQQEPRVYLFPGLPQIQFQPRATLPWLETLEQATDDIRAELLALTEPGLFQPYVQPVPGSPNIDTTGMKSNPDWSALFLWKDGVEQTDIAGRCPRTMDALSDLPLCRIKGHTPSILFSRLRPGARIPAHTGMVNTRLICHLPLIAPAGCRFRVGNDVREWQEGQAWAFDDTIEHEAVNTSTEDRTILLFDVWKPELSAEERDLVTAMFDAIDGFGGPRKAWGV